MASAAEQLVANLNWGSFSKATDLKKRLWFTLGALIVFRLCSFVPLPAIDPVQLELLFDQTRGGVLDFVNMFSGGALERMSIVALNIMPYITASIIVQLMTSLSPSMAQLKKEGESGRKKINQYTRYGTVALTLFQGYGIELEYAVVDRATFAVRPVVGELLKRFAGSYVGDFDDGPVSSPLHMAVKIGFGLGVDDRAHIRERISGIAQHEAIHRPKQRLDNSCQRFRAAGTADASWSSAGPQIGMRRRRHHRPPAHSAP